MFDGTQSVSWFIALLAGVLSFASPCVFPLIPSYISFITGLSLRELRYEGGRGFRVRGIAAVNAALFVLGFTMVFTLLGAGASFLGGFLRLHLNILNKVAGALIVIFGFYLMGALKIGFLARERRVDVSRKPFGTVGSLLVGMAFAAGWTPCIGPILSAILILAGSEGSVYRGMWLLGGYSLGLGVPFFLTAIALDAFLNLSNRMRRYMRAISIASGAFLVIVGVLVFTGYLQRLSALLIQITGFRGI
ncbi:MAG: cytochrome c biogenesis CcdA family protein [bacterium]